MASGGKALFEEFIVDTKQVSQITHAKTKIERMHEVTIVLNEIHMDSKESKQWIRVEGEIGDRTNAREYIIAMCQPSETTTYQLPLEAQRRDFLNDENLEEIEKQTNACVEVNDSNMLLIKGTDMAVTLAISSLENIIGQARVEFDGVAADSSDKSKKDASSSASSIWEKRLNTTFLRALSRSSDGSCKFDDYHNTSPEVKMAILKCLNNDYSDNVDEHDLFDGSGKQISAGTTALHPITIYGDDDAVHVNTGEDGKSSVQDNTSTPEEVADISEQLTDTNISPSKQPTEKVSESEDVKFLRTFGTSAGYTDEIIDEGLLYIDDKTAPCDFLDILKQLKNSKKSEDITVDTAEESKNETDNKTTLAFPPPPQITCDESGQSRRSLPKEYKQTLVKHMLAEQDGEMSVVQMKKLNEERQKILKDQFGSPSTPGDSPRESKGRRKKKNKKKANKKVNQNNNLVEQNSMNVDDDDETCVLKTYNSSSEDDCMITEVKEPTVPVYVPVQPKLPVNHYPPTQRQPHGPVNNYARNHYPVEQRHQQPSTSMASRELRYIVIDGSNVAMHHGRGKIFSCKGIQICIDYFIKRGHPKITCFVPAWRRYRPRPQNPISDQELLVELNEKGLLEFTPARRLDNKLISSYDDRYVVELAETVDGIIVSNDQYRDLMNEKASWKRLIEERLLQYNFVGDNFMVPHDPLGQYGPKLDEFLSKPSKQPSPHRKRHLSPSDTSSQPYWSKPPPLMDQVPLLGQFPRANWPQPAVNYQNQRQIQNNNKFQNWNNQGQNWNNQGQNWNNQGQNRFQCRQQGWPQNSAHYEDQGQNRYSNPSPQKKKIHTNQRPNEKNSKPKRTIEKTQEIVKELKDIFPNSEDKISEVVENHPTETDLTRLSNYLMSALD